MKELVFIDGGFGTMLQAAGLPAGKDPTDWNLENPAAVTAVHRAYVEAGSEIVLANTFGANQLKYHGAYSLAKLIDAALTNAWAAGPKRVALDIGPTGRLLKPAGDLDFEAAYTAYAEMVKAALGAEKPPALIFIETMSDLYELKAAVVAAKDHCQLPIYATVSLGEDGKLLTGGEVEGVATLLEALKVDAYGFNCGLGPKQLLPLVKRLAAVATKPIIVKPNAGMPLLVEGKTVFDIGPKEFAALMGELTAAGARIVGGCCGTTPKHIEAVRKLKSSIVNEEAVVVPDPESKVADCVSSGTSVVKLHPYEGLIIGERINPTGKKALKEAYAKGDTAYILREAVKQVEAGARILDVNCGVPGLNEAELLVSTVSAVQSVVSCPIELDTADPKALEIALRRVNGKPLINSVNGKRESMAMVFPLVKRYGGVMVALCLDEQGIPPNAEGRIAIARRILAAGAAYGFTKDDFVFDALTLAVSADPTAALVTLETVKRLTEELKVNTVLGVSNVSFALPDRPALNNAMYTLAKRAGLSAAIANPALIRECEDEAAFAVLLGKDLNCANWIARCSAETSKPVAVNAERRSLASAITCGLKEDARLLAAALLQDGKAPLAIIQSEIVPALETVGKGFEAGRVYLPQLLMAADAAGEALAMVKRVLAETKVEISAMAKRRPIVLATVKGDIHDIGKNIVRSLLENYGFEVIDLGRDVAPEKIVEAAEKANAMLVGLSALMTTTVGAMAATVRLVKARLPNCRTCVGGAVVTQEYADSIAADHYAKDAMATVRYAETLK